LWFGLHASSINRSRQYNHFLPGFEQRLQSIITSNQFIVYKNLDMIPYMAMLSTEMLPNLVMLAL
jgi:hypothetical protein